MPSETRTIYFDQAELQNAVAKYPERDRVAPTHGRLVEVVAEPGRIDIVSLHYITDVGREEIYMSYAQFLGVLIHSCGLLSIPLPRRGQKHIMANGDSIAIVVRISEKSGDAFVEEMQKIEAVARGSGLFAAN